MLEGTGVTCGRGGVACWMGRGGIAQVSSVVCVVMVQCSILTNVVGCEKPNLAQCCEMKFTTWVGGPWDI